MTVQETSWTSATEYTPVTVKIPVTIEIEIEKNMSCFQSVIEMMKSISCRDVAEALINVENNEICRQCIQAIAHNEVRIEPA